MAFVSSESRSHEMELMDLFSVPALVAQRFVGLFLWLCGESSMWPGRVVIKYL